MKKAYPLLVVLITVVLCVNAQSFEGTFRMRIEIPQKKNTSEMQLTFKGDKVCMEMITAPNAGKLKTILDKKAHTMTILVEKDAANKIAMVHKIADLPEMENNETSDSKIKVTTELKTIEGRSCNKIIVETDGSVTEMWVTDKLGLSYSEIFEMMTSGRGPASNLAMNMHNYKDVKGIPLEMHISNKARPDEDTIITLKNIKKQKINDSIFDTSGYKIIETK